MSAIRIVRSSAMNRPATLAGNAERSIQAARPHQAPLPTRAVPTCVARHPQSAPLGIMESGQQQSNKVFCGSQVAREVFVLTNVLPRDDESAKRTESDCGRNSW